MWKLLFSFTFIVLSKYCTPWELTEVLDGHQVSCYHVVLNPGQRLELVEGLENLHFYIQDPNRHVLYNIIEKIGRFEFQAQVMGEYVTCFDNQRFAEKKSVYFDFLIDGHDADNIFAYESIVEKDEVSDRFENATHRLDVLKNQLDLSHHLLNMRRVMETRDKHLLDGNLSMVNRWSMIYLAILITVAVTQVLMIRSLFDDKSRLRQILRTKTSW